MTGLMCTFLRRKNRGAELVLVSAGLAMGAATCLGQPNCPSPGDCCVSHGSPGCNQPACCQAVCEQDPFCCQETWDQFCANLADKLCGNLCDSGVAGCPPPDGCQSPTACLFDGIPNIALGQAQLFFSPRGNLVVTNIGSSGQDGVKQEPLPPDSTEMATGIACPNFALSQLGTKAVFKMFADLPVPDGLCTILTVENIDGQTLSANADMSPVFAPSYTIQTSIGSHMTASVPNLPSGQVFFDKVDLNEIDCYWDGPFYYICYKLTWVVDISIPGFGVAQGDIIYVCTNPPLPCEPQTKVENYFINTGPMEMTFQYGGPTRPINRCGPGPDFGPCCQVNSTPGCHDPKICDCVCDVDPFCCHMLWDEICVEEAQSLGCVVCPGSCCQAHALPGCNDPAIQACVCAFDSFCCDVTWDSICVNEVQQFGCGVCSGPCAPDGCFTPFQCVFDGLPNVALGNAALFINANCHLVVTNIGSSGQDGVRQFPLPPTSQEMVTGMACPNFALSQQGTMGRFLMFGDVAGGLVSELSVTNVDGQNLHANADFSPSGATLYTIQIMIGNTMVTSVPNLPSGLVIFPKTDINEMDCRIDNPLHISAKLTCVVPITLPNGDICDGDVIWILAQDPTSLPTVQTAIDNLFANTGPVELTFEYAGPAEVPMPVCGPAPGIECCFEPHDTPGCNDSDCCSQVCAIDPFCCINQWDGICVSEANDLCNPCLADIDNSGAVNIDDLLGVIANWGPCLGCPADIDNNGAVNIDDLLAVITNWGPC